MLPSIGQLGGALLALFAAEKVFGWAEAGVDAIRKMYTGADQGIKDLDAAATAAFKHAQQGADELCAHFKTSAAGSYAIKDIDARMSQLECYYKAYQLWDAAGKNDLKALESQTADTIRAISDARYEGLTSIEEVNQKINETGQLQFDARKRMAEVEKKDSADLCEAVKRQAAEEAQAAKAALEHYHQQEQLSNEAAMSFLENYRQKQKVLLEWAGETEALNRLDEQHIALMREEEIFQSKAYAAEQKELDAGIKGVNQRELSNRLLKETKDESERLYQAWSKLHPVAAQMRSDLHLLGIETQNLSAHQLDFIAVENQVTKALDQELLAYGFTSKAMEGLLADELRTLGGFLTKKAHMKALEQLAEAAGAWPDFAAMAQHAEAAAMWEVLGAGVSGLTGMGAAATTGNTASYSTPATPATTPAALTQAQISALPALPPGYSYNQYGTPTQIAPGQASPISGNVTVVVGGDAKIAAWVAAVVNTAVLKNDVKLTASHVKNPPMVRR
jgi:hypothetical protein